jgi:hypothetical protein
MLGVSETIRDVGDIRIIGNIGTICVMSIIGQFQSARTNPVTGLFRLSRKPGLAEASELAVCLGCRDFWKVRHMRSTRKYPDCQGHPDYPKYPDYRVFELSGLSESMKYTDHAIYSEHPKISGFSGTSG